MRKNERHLPFTGRKAKTLRRMLADAKVPDRSALEKGAKEARKAIAAYMAKINGGEENDTEEVNNAR